MSEIKKFKSVTAAVSELGESEALSCLNTGYKQKFYRKEQNAKNQRLLELAKNDPRFKQQVADEFKKKSA
jgi:hypothetical protein